MYIIIYIVTSIKVMMNNLYINSVHWCLHCDDLKLRTMTKFVTWHEKIGLICTQNIPLQIIPHTYLTLCVRYTSSVNCIKYAIVCYTSCESSIDKLCMDRKLWNFKFQKGSQILCTHTVSPVSHAGSHLMIVFNSFICVLWR